MKYELKLIADGESWCAYCPIVEQKWRKEND